MTARLFCLRGFSVVTSPIQACGPESNVAYQSDPRENVVQFLRAIKLKRAKHYLQMRGIKPWTKWKREKAQGRDVA